MRNLFNKFLFLYCAFLVAYVIYGFAYIGSQDSSLIPDKKIILLGNGNGVKKLESEHHELKSGENVETKSKPKSNIYDKKIEGFDATRLGYAIESDFQVLPRSWQNILSERKGQVLNAAVVKSEEEKGNTNVTSKSVTNISSSTSKNASSSPAPEHKNVTEPEPEIIEIRPKKILLYDSFQWWRFNESTDCPQNPEFKCQFIDRSITFPRDLNSDQNRNDLDAILMVRDFAHSDRVELDSYNKNRMVNETVRRIYFALESPFPANHFEMQAKPTGNSGTRDYLASYWRGSDIYAPYFAWRYFDNKVTHKPQERNYAEGRSKTAAIVVSNCNAHNNRLGLVEELKKYIKVDVFGACGDLECRETNCFENIKKNYKFYLAFENSNCRDYITEKLYNNAFKNDLLPVVLGAHPQDYKATAPANSYIHIEDYESVKELGHHLQNLDKDDTMYNAYFEWKGTGEFYSRNFMCEVCAFLHTEHLKEVKTFETNIAQYSNPNDKAVTYFNRDDTYNFDTFFWSQRNELMCLKNNHWYWNQ